MTDQDIDKKKENYKQHKNISILVVDDDKMAQKQITKLLEGFNVNCVSSGKEALETMEKKTYAVVLADYQMPGMNGVELLIKIKKIHSMVQVIMITGSDDLTTLITSLSHGADDFIPKPVKKATLLMVLGNTCDKITRWTGVMKTLKKKQGSK